jgi:hypothetical protein
MARAKTHLLFKVNEGNQHGQRDHGAAVMGVIGALDDEQGITGIAPNLACLNAVSHYEQDGTRYHVADAISVAVCFLSPGDILLLEVVRYYPEASSDSFPTETDAVDHDAIRLAVAAGIVVVEAAGNAGSNLDEFSDGMVLDRNASEFLDSGAIMVGAGVSAVSGTPAGHARENDSNFGNRVDCYAWGDSIVTAGYGDKSGLEGGLTSYTEQFGHTSGASAIIAGVATVVQSWGKARCVNPLDSVHMRTVLSNPGKGTPQTVMGSGTIKPIGVMPDLRRILWWPFRFRIILWCLFGWIFRLVALVYRPDRQHARRS